MLELARMGECLMRIMTSERCPQCTQLLWIELANKIGDDGDYITINGHGLGANVFLDHNGVLNVVDSDMDCPHPSYHCHLCGWSL